MRIKKEDLHFYELLRDFLHKYLAEQSYYAPFHKNFKHRMYSVSKSFVSIAVGLAAEDGLLSLDDKMVIYFPEYMNEYTNDLLNDMTIREMLTMETCKGTYTDAHIGVF